MEKFHITKNKVRVYSYNMPHLHGFYLQLCVRAGEIYENPRGITHFLEHVYCESLDNRFQNETVRDLDKYGLTLNAHTGRSGLSFEIDGNAAFFKEAAKILVNILDPDLETEKAYKIEKERLIREIEESYYPTSIRNLALSTVWEGTPLSAEEDSDIIQGISLRQLKTERKKIFNAANLFFYVAGPIPQEDLEYFYELIEGYQVEPNGKERKNSIARPENFGARNVKIYQMPTTVNVNSVALCVDYDATKFAPHEIQFIGRLWFYGHGSVLYSKLSGELGLIYDYDSSKDSFDNIGNISYNFDVAQESMLQAIQAAVNVLRDAKHEINDFDFERVKAYHTNNTHYILDNVEEMCDHMAFDNHIYNYGYTEFHELIDRYNAITKERLMQIAQELFRPDNITLVIKWQKKPDIKKIRAIVMKALDE